MENSEPGTSTSNTSRGEYQVFLSFRGHDTRHVFTDILHQAMIDAGIRVFIDEKELQLGEKIRGNLEQAINNSKLYIPIFSKNYASSPSCLYELVRMVDKSKEDEKKVILPIFYDVKPDDVKSNLEQKMEVWKNKFGPEDIKKWRQALQEVGGIGGWEPKKDSGYTELVGAVVEEIVVRLKTRERRVTEYLVGMEDRIVAINNLLDIDSDTVLLIGIYGMGGIGKTTLAKIIFNQLCPRFGKNCSFLEDVSKMTKSKGLKTLQEKLLCDISFSGVACKILDIDHDINMIGETICNKKMLIVLDDVDEAYQIQKLIGEKPLYPGTRILITTRDKSVLNIRGFKYKFEPYEMVQLSDKDGIKLFNGLPLALQVIGSSLFREKREIWVECLDKLEKAPHEDVLATLKISYDALEQNEQEIFLDIACFFIGENKTNPMYMWKECKFYPESAIEVLINKCMIKELDDDSLWMHKQFRDLGRVIAKDQHTRLWNIDDIIDIFNSTEGSVQALHFNLRDSSKGSIIVTSEQIKRFPCIWFLSLCEVDCQGDFTGCLSELKWISLDYDCDISPRPAAAYKISLDRSYAIPPRPAAAHHQRFEAASAWHLENAVVLNRGCVESFWA
ncbi:hypothetical protein BT93_H1354 [Corymbia citriodora subsp. variegata]|nr:hypothetical protein BT93_H1354 [Corymbia citriodora subsp. variegata]